MSDDPVVSVIMPTYQRLTYLREALESVLAQTYTDFEVVVTDNSAADAVRDLVLSYGDERVRYRHNDGNVGLQANVLAGYRAARGQLLATLHDDDVWERTFLAELVPPMLADPTIALAFCDYSVMGADGLVDPRATDRNTRQEGRHELSPGLHRDGLALAVVHQSIQTSYAAVFRRSVDLDAVPSELAPLHDLWIAFLATVDGAPVWYSPQRLTRYRHHGGSATSSNPFHTQEAESYDRFLSDPRLAALAPALRRKKARAQARTGLRLLLELDDRVDARRTFLASLWTSPNPLAAAGLAGSAVPGAGSLLRRARTWQHRRSMTVTSPPPR